MQFYEQKSYDIFINTKDRYVFLMVLISSKYKKLIINSIQTLSKRRLLFFWFFKYCFEKKNLYCLFFLNNILLICFNVAELQIYYSSKYLSIIFTFQILVVLSNRKTSKSNLKSITSFRGPF